MILLAGPTAVGKSEVALRMAEQLGGEIVSVDSMQVYRGLDIGTAKPSPEQLARVPHHLVDIVNLTDPFDAAQFVSFANQAIEQIRSRRRTPILCGGTGLYFRALLEGLGHAPPPNQALRSQLEQTPLIALLHELKARDPSTFETIDRQNPRRVIRAIEVIRLTGRPFSQQRAAWHTNPQPNRTPFFVLARTAEDLGQRISNRVDEMFARGLVAETKRLLEHGLGQNRAAKQALGYRQVAEHLNGERSLPATIDLVKTRTRQFAKRQMTWFRKQPGVIWVQIGEGERAEEVSMRLIDQVGDKVKQAK
jgi:tRNA dimethylallyltransferase